MGKRSRKYIKSFLAFVMCGVICSALPVMAQQSDTCSVIRGSKLEDYTQFNEARTHFPEQLSKKITKSFAKKLKQARYHTEYEIAEIAFRLPDDSSRELELNVEPYSEQSILNPQVKQALIQAIQDNLATDSGGIQKEVCYRAIIEYGNPYSNAYSKPHPWKTAIMIISLPVLIPLYAICIWGL